MGNQSSTQPICEQHVSKKQPISKESITIQPISKESITIPITAVCITDSKFNAEFTVAIPYATGYTIEMLIDKIIELIKKKNFPDLNDEEVSWRYNSPGYPDDLSSVSYKPIYFSFDHAEATSFTGYISSKSAVLVKSITKYDTTQIINKGIKLQFRIARHYETEEKIITCEHMIKHNTRDPIKCPIYKSMLVSDASKSKLAENLDHLNTFAHFTNEYVQKPKCHHFSKCEAYIHYRKGKDELKDKCHLKLYQHPPLSQNLKLHKDINALILHKNASQNHPLYEPTFDDEKFYKYNQSDGYLEALVEEVVNNGFSTDLCLQCHKNVPFMRCGTYLGYGNTIVSGNPTIYDEAIVKSMLPMSCTTECKHKDYYSLVLIAVDKIKSPHHRSLGSPLNRAQMLSILLYTGANCNYDMAKCQRNGDYQTWKWFDMILYNAIKLLSERESGQAKCYSGLDGVKSDIRFIPQAWFPTYNSTSIRQDVAKAFMRGNGGIIMCYDERFMENSICCDVSWISKFPDEQEVLFARSVSKNYSCFECNVLDDIGGIQWVMIREPITQKTNNMINKFRDLKQIAIGQNHGDEKVENLAPIKMQHPIGIKCSVKCSTDINDKHNLSFMINVPYTKQCTLQLLVNQILFSVEIKHKPTKFVFDEINEESFTKAKISNSDKHLLTQSITRYNKDDIMNKGIFLSVHVPLYEHKTLAQIDCPLMLKENTEDPIYCTYWAKLKWQYEYSSENLYHMQNYHHFKNEFSSKTECRYGDQCHGFKNVVNGGSDIKDLCHMMIFLHPPRRRNVKLSDNCGFGEFKINNEENQNIEVYKPTEYDKVKYNYDDKHGFLEALEEEVIQNGYKYDLCLTCSNEQKKCHHDKNKFRNMKKKYVDGDHNNALNLVYKKLDCNRHKKMGSPLNAAEMLSIILYTAGESNWDLCKSQREGNYKKWIWFDYCLYSAIKKLHFREWGIYTLWSGIAQTKLTKKVMKKAYFKTYVSSSWQKVVADSFLEGKGILLKIDESFRKSFGSVCCDVSWISKFGVQESEILIARGTSNDESFELRVIDHDQGTDIQIVLLSKK